MNLGFMVTLSVSLPGVFPPSGHGNCFQVAWQHRQAEVEVLLTNYRPSVGVITSNSAHLIIPPPSISLPPFIPPLTSGYLTAKTNCLTEWIHNSSYTLLIYTSTAPFLRANMEKVCKPCDANIIQTCSGSWLEGRKSCFNIYIQM